MLTLFIRTILVIFYILCSDSSALQISRIYANTIQPYYQVIFYILYSDSSALQTIALIEHYS